VGRDRVCFWGIGTGDPTSGKNNNNTLRNYCGNSKVEVRARGGGGGGGGERIVRV